MDNWLYKNLVRPALFQMDVEEAHNLGHKLLPPARGLMEVAATRYLSDLEPFLSLLATTVAGAALAHPIGLAAGFDKNAKLTAELLPMGFSFAEIGSVTAQATVGNPLPRLFRLAHDEAVINRLGLNGDGAQTVSSRLTAILSRPVGLPLALNIAPTNVPNVVTELDIAGTFEYFKNLPLAFVTINTSCPNTHDGVLHESSQLRNILSRVGALNSHALPLYLKFSPDSSDDFLAHAVDIAREFGVTGFVLGNTSTSRDGLVTSQARLASIGNGGLSGKPIRLRALDLVRRVAKLKAEKQEIIACGGISSAADILDVVRSGACAVQIYTAMIYEGPFHALRLRRDLALALSKQGRSLTSLIGADL